MLSEAPEELGPLLADAALQHTHGIAFPLVVRSRPGGGANRLRGLRRRIARQAAINRTSWVQQFVAALLYRRFLDPKLPFEPLEPDLEVAGVNGPELVEAVRTSAVDLLVIMNCGVLDASTIDAIAVPIVNVHDGDPAVMRGRPPCFWDIREGRTKATITVHEVIATVDAGAVIARTEIPIEWARGLRATLAMTERSARAARHRVLCQALEQLAAGTARPVAVEPGPLRTLPALRDLAAAARICRAQSGARPSSPQ